MKFIYQVKKNPLIYIALAVIILYAYMKLFRSEGIVELQQVVHPRMDITAMKEKLKVMKKEIESGTPTQSPSPPSPSRVILKKLGGPSTN